MPQQGQVRMPQDVIQLSNLPTYVRHVDNDNNPVAGDRMLANQATRSLLLVDWQPYDVPTFDLCWDFPCLPLIPVPRMMRPTQVCFGKTRSFTRWWAGSLRVVGRRTVDLPRGVVCEMDAFWASQEEHTDREFRVSVEHVKHLLRDVDIHPELLSRLVWDIPCVCYERSADIERLGVVPWSAGTATSKGWQEYAVQFGVLCVLVRISKPVYVVLNAVYEILQT